MQHTEFAGPEPRLVPPVVAGSHDPLLEWALRQSGATWRCSLAATATGCVGTPGQAAVAGVHLLDADGGDWHVAAARGLAGMADIVLIE